MAFKGGHADLGQSDEKRQEERDRKRELDRRGPSEVAHAALSCVPMFAGLFDVHFFVLLTDHSTSVLVEEPMALTPVGQLFLKFAAPVNTMSPAMSCVQPDGLVRPFENVTLTVGK